MAKYIKEIVVIGLSVIILFLSGMKLGYDEGFNEGVEVNHGDKWDCAYSYSTGFLMCDRTPKYKD